MWPFSGRSKRRYRVDSYSEGTGLWWPEAGGFACAAKAARAMARLASRPGAARHWRVMDDGPPHAVRVRMSRADALDGPLEPGGEWFRGLRESTCRSDAAPGAWWPFAFDPFDPPGVG